MGFRFKSASCVVVGTFNIYIIQPRLLREMGLLDDSQKVNLQSDFSQPGIRMQIKSQTWNVRPERISIESPDPNCDCGEPLAQVLEKLVWTPTMAVGVNAVFIGNEEFEESLPPSFRPPQSDGFQLIQRSCHASIREGEQIFNVQLSKSEKGLELALNVHTEFSRDHKSQLDVNKLAQDACRTFGEQKSRVTAVAKKLLDCEEFSYVVLDGN